MKLFWKTKRLLGRKRSTTKQPSRRPGVRRLAIELMEDRLMLSGTSLDFTPVLYVQDLDGGYIQLGYVQVTGSVGVFDATNLISDTDSSGIVAGADGALLRRIVPITNSNSDFLGDLFSGGEPIEIKRIPNPTSPAPTNDPISGGPIDIAVAMKPVLEMSLGVQGIAKRHESLPQGQPQGQRPGEQLLLGQWARAIPFEVVQSHASADKNSSEVGSDPIENNSLSSYRIDSAANLKGPFSPSTSAVVASLISYKKTSIQSEARTNEAEAATRPMLRTDFSHTQQPTNARITSQKSDPMAGSRPLSSANLDQTNSTSSTIEEKKTALPTDAQAAAFSQWSNADSRAALLAVDRRRDLDHPVAMPLLALLAMERLTRSPQKAKSLACCKPKPMK